MKKFIFPFWFFSLCLLFFYSFTQIDLGLSLSRFPFLFSIQRIFQTLGYFYRPQSTLIYLVILLFLFTGYLLTLWKHKELNINRTLFWQLFLTSVLILTFSYPAFSYDIFNYMFDAKTIIYYHQSPWVFKPLDFPNDSWLSFMHWTHRPSVYPFFGVLLTIPFYFLSFNYFILALFNFKILMAISLLFLVYILEKLLIRTGGKNIYQNLIVFAFNPLVLIESLVSAHNDIVMMALGVLSVFLYKYHSKFKGYFTLLLSVLVKYTSVSFSPAFLYDHFLKRNNKHDYFYQILFLSSVLVFLLFITKIEIQPWYLLWVFPLFILTKWFFLRPLFIIFSCGLLLRYAPYLYFGNWDPPVPDYKFWITVISLLSGVFASLVFYKKIIHA